MLKPEAQDKTISRQDQNSSTNSSSQRVQRSGDASCDRQLGYRLQHGTNARSESLRQYYVVLRAVVRTPSVPVVVRKSMAAATDTRTSTSCESTIHNSVIQKHQRDPYIL
jgi:hypothetical protein